MTVVPLMRAKHLILLADYLSRAGVPIQPILEKAKLPFDTLGDPEKLVPCSSAWHFRELVAHITGLQNVEIDATKHLEITVLGDLGNALMRTPTLYRLLTKFSTLARSESSITHIATTKQHNGDVLFSSRFSFSQELGEWQSNLYILCWMLKLVRMVSPSWSPSVTWVGCATPHERPTAIEKLSLEIICFEKPYTGFMIPRSMLALPIPLRHIAEDATTGFDEQRIWSGAPDTNFTSTLRQALLSYSKIEWLHIDAAAEVIGSSVRTVQRRLSEEGTTYSAVVETARAAIGARLLEFTDTKLEDISEQLGYSNQSNFTRAFYRWTGVSPLEYRRRQMIAESQ